MAHLTETTFADFQNDERYKRLKRASKLASLTRGKKQKGYESWSLPMSPSISSINIDASDSSTNIPILQAFKNGSGVVSSSNNLRNTFLKKKDVSSNHNTIATSTVKRFNKETDCQEDYFMMPPPNFDHVHRNSKKLNNVVTSDITNIGATSQSEYTTSDVLKEFPRRSSQNKKAKVFTRWKVTLNEQSQLIITGTIECGQIARSKPILRRLTTTIVESVCQHLYHLQGNIVDAEYELPDYVRNKFYNGFPDDWENVYQIWRIFIQQGCKVTFRWPTPIADSDDDLRSEITEITFAQSESPENEISNSKSFKKLYTYQACTSNILQSQKNRENQRPYSHKINDRCDQTCMSDTNPVAWPNYDKENYKQQETLASNYFNTEHEKNKLKDKLNIFINNLTDKSRSQAFVDIIGEMFTYINNVVSHGSNVVGSKSEQNERAVQESISETGSGSKKYCPSELIPLHDVTKFDKDKTIVLHKHPYAVETEHIITNCNNLLQKKKTFTKMDKTKDNNNSDSESEVYAGIPKISAERILQQKKSSIEPHKRKAKKKCTYQKYDTSGQKHTLGTRSVESYTGSPGFKICKINSVNHNDSSVSIIEDIKDKRKPSEAKQYINSSDEGNVNKHTKSDTVENGQWERINAFLRDKNTYEVREHFIEKNSMPSLKSTKSLCHSFNIIENDKCEINGIRRSKIESAKENFCMETFKERSKSMSHQYQNLASHEQPKGHSSQSKEVIKNISKPIVISSVLVDADTIHSDLKCFSAEPEKSVIKVVHKDIKEPNEEIQGSIQKESPSKKPNAIRNTNSISLIGSKQDSEEHSKVPRKLIQDKRGSKSKSLSAWTPRVIGKSELSLIFEGNLLNEVGHVMHRKFKTDVVLRRLSPKLIETVRHEFYQLVGNLNDTKHVIPKQLLNQCRHGCPSRIELFCKSWKSLESGKIDNVEALNDTVDTINVGISSKGRRIIPPLCYWAGERVALKDNNPVYTPASLQDSQTISSSGSPNKRKHVKKTTIQENNENRKSNLDEGKNRTANFLEKLANIQSAKDLKEFDGNERKELPTKKKRKIVQRLSESSDSIDADVIPVYKRQKVEKHQQKSSTSTNIMKKQDDRLVNAENLRKPYLVDVEETKLTRSVKSKAGGRSIEPNTLPVRSKEMSSNHHQLVSARNYRDIVCAYYQDIPPSDCILSDDQDSRV